MRHPPAHRRIALILAPLLLLARAALAQPTPADAADDAAAPFYRPDEVQSVHLTIAEPEQKAMLAALPSEIFVRATFRWRDVTLDDVAVRFKGNSSSSPRQTHKRSFLIKFNQYDAGKRFLGLRRASLDNGIQFGSLFSEPIITDILRKEGLPVHRCNYARLYLNGKFHGVYVNVERIDEAFIEHHLAPPAAGPLFKVDRGGPGGNLRFVGDDPAPYANTFTPENKPAKSAVPQLVDLIRLIDRDPPADFAEKLDAAFETDAFLRTAAVMLFSGAFDQLTGWNPHNYYLYRGGGGGAGGRWRYLPWDLDVGFCDTAFGHIKVLDDWDAAWPLAGRRANPLMERVLNDPALLKRYRDAARAILDKHFEPEALCAAIDAKYALIKGDLKADPFPHRRITNPGDRDYDGIVASMKDFVRKRYAAARRQLDDPGPRPAVEHHPDVPPAIARRLQRVMRGAQAMQRAGQSVQGVQRLMRQVGPLLQSGKTDEADQLIGEALKLVGDGG